MRGGRPETPVRGLFVSPLTHEGLLHGQVNQDSANLHDSRQTSHRERWVHYNAKVACVLNSMNGAKKIFLTRNDDYSDLQLEFIKHYLKVQVFEI